METKIIAKQLIWCRELWVDWDDIDFDLPEKYYGPSPTNSFYDLQDPDEGYILRGVGTVGDRKILDRKHDYY